MVDPLLGWRGSGWWPGGFLVCSAPSGGRQSGHHHSSAQVGRGGTARRPLAVLSLLIAASRMARYQVTKMSTSAVQIADRFLCGGDHLWQAVHGVRMKLQGNPHLRVLMPVYIVSWNEVKGMSLSTYSAVFFNRFQITGQGGTLHCSKIGQYRHRCQIYPKI